MSNTLEKQVETGKRCIGMRFSWNGIEAEIIDAEAFGETAHVGITYFDPVSQKYHKGLVPNHFITVGMLHK